MPYLDEIDTFMAARGGQLAHDVTPDSAGWRFLSFKVVSLKKGQSFSQPTGNNEVALVPLTPDRALVADDQSVSGNVGAECVPAGLSSVW